MTHRELGAKILKKLSEELSDIAEVEVAPKMEGYQMFTIFVPKKIAPEVKKKAAPKPAEPTADGDKKKERVEKPKGRKGETGAQGRRRDFLKYDRLSSLSPDSLERLSYVKESNYAKTKNT
jgi:translation initiation factor IF-3